MRAVLGAGGPRVAPEAPAGAPGHRLRRGTRSEFQRHATSTGAAEIARMEAAIAADEANCMPDLTSKTPCVAALTIRSRKRAAKDAPSMGLEVEERAEAMARNLSEPVSSRRARCARHPPS